MSHDATTLDLQRLLKLKKRQLALAQARDSLLRYCQLQMPDPKDFEDTDLTRFVSTPQARILCQIMEKVERGELKRVAVAIGPQLGKALAVGTPIPTPKGWTPIESLAPGDYVFDEHGKPVRVVAKSEIFRDRQVYEVRTDDGFSVVADAAHEWPVRCSRSYPVVRMKTTARLAVRSAQRNVRLQIHGELDLPDTGLPIDPYCLGAWLGDGSASGPIMTAPGDDGAFIEAQFVAAGYTPRRHTDSRSFGVVGGFGKLLAEAGLLRNKHIPLQYFRASAAQRLALLQGLIDTDGHCSENGNIEFCNTNRTLAEGVRELVVSLGRKCRFAEERATLYGKDCGPRYRVCFYMANAARLPRKAANCRDAARMANRYITVAPAGRADTVCIQVDSPTHLYLCGRGMLVTHNSEVLSRRFPAWCAGRNPYRNLMLGTYNQTFAEEFGGEVRASIEAPIHQTIFPEHRLDKGALNLLISDRGGKTAFVGVGGSGTGKPADFFVVDDPIRSDEDAQSQVYRDKIWKWFNAVVFTRCHSKSGIVVVHTRWHADDLIGRLCDPDHPERNKEYKGIADRWTYINIPAVVDDPKLAADLGLTLEVQTDPLIVEQFGSKPISALWPERKGLDILAEARNSDQRVFNALYMGRPSADDGEYFRAVDIVEYDVGELPADLKLYGASDHAVSTKQDRDYTVLGCVGVDENEDIWVLPDLVWERMQTDQTVEALLAQFRSHKPELWWMEDELISKSFGPFLHKRMVEERIFTTIDTVRPSKDKPTRARAIQGRMRMRKVRFPRYAHWYRDARSQLLRFPYGANDDFVDWLAHIGAGLMKARGQRLAPANTNDAAVGSIQWIMQSALKRSRLAKAANANRGW
jgi:predicted phage terminase large subunit-like protein